MNLLAKELNSILEETIAGRMLSGLGKRLYFPKGIIAQSAEAKKLAHTANGTIGMALNKGTLMLLPAVSESLPNFSAQEIAAYAPTAGVEEVRQAWKNGLLRKNPSLKAENCSLPVVVPGLSSGISYIADLFLDHDETILVSDPCWDNYSLIFADRRDATVAEIPFFNGSTTGLDMHSIREGIKAAAEKGPVRIILNFPNNPSGYSPSKKEAEELSDIIREVAEAGQDVLVICDDAYFGLFYEDDINKESLFARFSGLHEKVLAIKIDGPTKEDYVWGLRMGFITFGCKGLNADHYDALIKKLMGGIRSSVSCSNTPAQYLVLQTSKDPRTAKAKEENFAALKQRYTAVKQFIADNELPSTLAPLPFNSGYFMSFRCIGIQAETLRQELLNNHGIGTIAIGKNYLRVAFSSIDLDLIPLVYKTIYETAKSMSN
ncbi:MAG: aminotransferase class I/II-fold pyridoxal phosphate-dependent enzyme [Treponema sp.]|nr:aminotransferase class I/II-fold pyridoxal phosphate-dependent enzyme [Treponema sp.]